MSATSCAISAFMTTPSRGDINSLRDAPSLLPSVACSDQGLNRPSRQASKAVYLSHEKGALSANTYSTAHN